MQALEETPLCLQDILVINLVSFALDHGGPNLTNLQVEHPLLHLLHSPYQNSEFLVPAIAQHLADPDRHMIEGLDNDDKYRMVEDEFLVMANKFTAHLHRAEYERLKNQAKSQNAATIADISRPVVGPLTEVARKRQEEVLRTRKQKEALRAARENAGILDDSEDEEAAPWKGTALQGLMDNSREKEVPLARFVRSNPMNPPSMHHAAAGQPGATSSIHQPQNHRTPQPHNGRKRPFDIVETESEDEGDLDPRPSRRPEAPAVAESSRRQHSTPAARPAASALMKDAASRAASSVPRHRVTESVSTPSKAFSSPAVKDASDSDDSDIFSSFMDRRRRDRGRSRPIKKEKKNDDPGETLDIIPTFLL